MFFQKRLNKDATYQSGLTMIELAIVLAIIGLIASSLIPTLTSTVKRGKMSEARSVLYAVRDEIIGYAEANDNTLPESLVVLGFPVDPWRRELRYHADESSKTIDICNISSTSLTYRTEQGEQIKDVAFVLASDGPDHGLDVALENSTDEGGNQDDLLAYMSLYHLQAVLCDAGIAQPFNGNGTFLDLGNFTYFEAVSDILEQNSGVVKTDGNATLQLGDPAEVTGRHEGSYGCTWFSGDVDSQSSGKPLCSNGECAFGKGFRAYFVFNVEKIGNDQLADGFTFSVISAGTNSFDSCGGEGSTIGYSSRYGTSSSDDGVSPFVNPPKIGIEFDFYTSSTFDDPSQDHLGIVYWGDNDRLGMDSPLTRGSDDNDHNPLIASPEDNPLPSEIKEIDGGINEDGSVPYEVRIEIDREDISDEMGNYTTQVWFDCQNCSDLNSTGEYESTIYLTHTVSLNSTWHSMFEKMMFGWTEGIGWSKQNVEIRNPKFYFKER